MNTAFIAVLLMSATGVLLVLCLAFLRPLTKNRFSAAWHYHTYMLVVFFLLVPIGTVCGNLLASIPNESGAEMPNVPVIINDIITAPQNSIIPEQPQQGVTPNPNFLAPATIETDSTLAPVIRLNVVLSYVPSVWLGGFFLFMVWHGIQLVRFKRKIIRTSLPIEDTATIGLLKNAMDDMRIKGDLRLYSNDIIKTPMLAGIFKTRLILPEIEMNDRELSVIFKHELIHYKRRDLWVKSLALLANSIHWFNPSAYRLTKQIDTFCELSCDERVVADMSMEERRFYGETILNVLCRVVSQHSGVYATLAESKKGIERRLSHMMEVKRKTKRVALISLVIAMLLCLTGFAAASVMNLRKDAEEIEKMKDAQEPAFTENLPQADMPDIVDESEVTDRGQPMESIRTETITLEGFEYEIQTKLYIGDDWLLYYDFEDYDVVIEENKTIIIPIGDSSTRYAYASIEHVSDSSLEGELRLHMEDAAVLYSEVSLNDDGTGFYAIHDDGKSGWSLDDYLLNVQLIPDGTGGCYVLSKWHVMEASEGHSVRLGNMFNSFTPLNKDGLPVNAVGNSNFDTDFQAFIEKWKLTGLISGGFDMTAENRSEFLKYFQQFDDVTLNYVILLLQGIIDGTVTVTDKLDDRENGVYLRGCEYYLYDMNGDDAPELILKTGIDEAGYQFTVYTTVDGGLIDCGSLFGGHASLLTDGSGDFVRYIGHMGTYEITVSALEGTTLVTKEIASGELDYSKNEDYPELSVYGYGGYTRWVEFTGIPTLMPAPKG